MLSNSDRIVAPHAGAWIETRGQWVDTDMQLVAPHVGAWVETTTQRTNCHAYSSLPMWERGLKRGDECGDTGT